MNSWPFKDSPNVAVFTSKTILDGSEWVYYVSHDEEDGAWQFHPYSGPTSEENASVVGLNTMVKIEPRILELSDLPLGWCAWREKKTDRWKRAVIEKKE
jgi:hypothetical protein